MHRNRARKNRERGAALIYALVAVTILTILSLAVGRLVTFHRASVDNSEAFARSLYVAETAANWQLNRINRYVAYRMNGGAADGAVEGTLQYVDWEASLNDGFTDAMASVFPGNARFKVWVRPNPDDGTAWTPGRSFRLVASGWIRGYGEVQGTNWGGTIREVGIARTVAFARVIPTSPTERFGLFAGEGGITFQGLSSTSRASLDVGYIGSNGPITIEAANSNWRPYARVSSVGVNEQVFWGCVLGGANIAVTPGEPVWTTGWDVQRMRSPVYWPGVGAVLSASGFSSDIATLRSQAHSLTGDNGTLITYRDASGDYVPLRDASGNAVTKLTQEEFDRARADGYAPDGTPLGIVRIRAQAGRSNLVVLDQLEMGADDYLVLDLRRPGSGIQPTLRIVLGGTPPQPNAPGNTGAPVTVTNLAYFFNGNSGQTITPLGPSFMWLNYGGAAMTFRPTRKPTPYDASTNPNGFDPAWLTPSSPDMQDGAYTLNPNYAPRTYQDVDNKVGVYGFVYSPGGDVTVDATGGIGVPLVITGVLGRGVTLRGGVIVRHRDKIEPEDDPNRYNLFYRLAGYTASGGYGDYNWNARAIIGHASPYDYGQTNNNTTNAPNPE